MTDYAAESTYGSLVGLGVLEEFGDMFFELGGIRRELILTLEHEEALARLNKTNRISLPESEGSKHIYEALQRRNEYMYFLTGPISDERHDRLVFLCMVSSVESRHHYATLSL